MWLTSKRSLTSRATLVVVLMVNIHLATQDDVQQPSNLDILQAITNLQSKITSLETEIFSEIQDLRKKMYSMENFCSETLHYKTALLENSFSELTNNSTQEIKTMIEILAKRDGSWSTWSSWSTCTATCGGGVKQRKRVCDAPAPAHGGSPCPGDAIVQDNCNPDPCPVHGGWSSWSSWGGCNAICGGGVKQRKRVCDAPAPAHGGSPCTGEHTIQDNCNPDPCPVHGGWSSWSSWGGCSATCGGGVKHRKRVCDAPAPAHGGLASLGEETLQDNCNPDPCPVHGGWSSWSSWEGCSATCGGGRQMSSRTCDNPPASNGGYQCAGDRTREENCNTQTCPIVCPEADGFILSAGGQQCLQVFMEQLSWEAAKALCMNKNLVLAKPQDPVELRKYLNGKYGDKWFHVGGRGTGSVFQWRDGTLLDSSSSMWRSGWSRSDYTSSDNCLALVTYNSDIRDYPATPYSSRPCSYTYPFICEVLQE
ncbi:unnamed protein product [Meganyctiphanes norvegica]|uniref:C-type lectin domain-containing protein n=1 Tax=Meganyctiphanes norvegica TaxID=48144 RepID=A0AAV2Q6P7_MEGNR